MDGAREFLEQIRTSQVVKGNLQALMHILIGRTISREDGTVLSRGMSWRQLADLFRLVRWDKESVRELGLDPDNLPPRDRQRYWYVAIQAAHVDQSVASTAADTLIPKLSKLGFVVSGSKP